MEAAKPVYLTVEEYFALEKEAEFRHEYFHGEIFAMSGTTMSECSVELFSRTQTSNWMLTELSTPDSILNLSCLNLEIPLTEIYEAIEFG